MFDRLAGTASATLFIALSFAAQATLAGSTDFDAPVVMDATQSVPPIDLPDAFGFGSVTYDNSTSTLSWDLSYEGLTGAITLAHIHSGAAGDTGGVIVEILGNSIDDGESLVGSTTITPQVADEILTGDTYVNLHTMDNGGGEIRGQVQQRQDFFREAGLDPEQEGVMLIGDVSNARGTGTVTYDATADEISWFVEFSGLTGPATLAHIHGPAARGETNGVLQDIGGNGLDSPLVGSSGTPPSGDFLAALLAGRTYFNIHTDDNGGGEIRGQIEPIVFEDGFEDGDGDVVSP